MIKIFYTYNMQESEVFIKKVLHNFCGMEFDIKYTENGKPYVDFPVYFSLSHTDNVMICAVSGSEIGADIEKIRPIKNKEKILKKFLACNKELSDAEFIKKWTEFESRVKYYGETLFKCPNAKKENVLTQTINLDDYVISVTTEINQNTEMEMVLCQ